MKTTAMLTERLVLRPPTQFDAPAINDICQDPLIQEWTLVPSPYTLADARTFISLTETWWQQDQPTWLVCLRAPSPTSKPSPPSEPTNPTGTQIVEPTSPTPPSQVAGIISYNNPLQPGGRGEVGYWANPQHRARGYLTEALNHIIDFGFEFGLAAIGWRCEVHDGLPNVASMRVAQKCGFVYDGCIRLEHLNKGRLYDSCIATLTPQDSREDTGPWP